MAEKPSSVNTEMEQPRIGTEIRVLSSQWFFLNSDVPACRVQRMPGMTHAWQAIDPNDHRGLIVFLHDAKFEIKPSCIVVITRVRRTVALARELKVQL